MADGIQIDINASWKGDAAVSQATASLSQLSRSAGNSSSSFFTAQGAINGWTKSTYIAAAGGAELARRALVLGEAVNRGKITADQASAAYRRYEAQVKQATWSSMTFGEKTAVVNKNLSTMAMSLAKTGAVAAGVGIAISKSFEFAKQGASLDFTAAKFDRLSASIGTTGNVLLRDLRDATKGTVSDFELMGQAATLVQLGLAKTREEAVRLARVQTALGMDTGQMVLSLANESKLRLDQLGISLVRFNQIRERVKATTGLTGQELYKETFLQTAEETIQTTGNQADSPLGNYQRVVAGMQNVKDMAKLAAANAPLTRALISDASNIMMAVSAVQRKDMAWDTSLPGVYGALDLLFSGGPVLRQGQASDFSDLWSGGGTQMGWTQMPGGRGGLMPQATPGLSAAQNYTAMAYAARYREGAGLQGLPSEGGEGAALDYGALLEGSLKITQQTEKYKETTEALNRQLIDEQTNLDQLNRTNRKAYDAISNQENRVVTLRDSLAELSAAGLENEEVYKNMSKQYQYQLGILDQLEKQYGKQSDQLKKQMDKVAKLKEDENRANKFSGGGAVLDIMGGMEGADPQKMLDFALAAGLVTQEAHAAQSAYIDVAKAVNDGTMAANAGALAAGSIAGALTRLDGERFTTYVDVIVNWIGQTNIFGGRNGLNRQNNAAVQLCFSADTKIAMADGKEKNIQDIQPGDVVLSWDFATDKLIAASVAEVFHHDAAKMGDYYLVVNQIMRVTPNHPLYINGEWQNAEMLKPGDVLKTVDGTQSVHSLVKMFRKIPTYNLHIDDENHNYFADGVLAHNKAEGGIIRAPGDGTRDTIMVPLANGEYVVNSRQAEKFLPLLMAINEGRVASGMYTGGMLGEAGIENWTPTSTRTASATTTKGTLGSRRRTYGGDVGGMSSSSVSAAVMEAVPEITAAVGGSVQQTIAASPQLQALAASVAELKTVNETLVAILEKTASAGDIGRAVTGDMARQA